MIWPFRTREHACSPAAMVDALADRWSARRTAVPRGRLGGRTHRTWPRSGSGWDPKVAVEEREALALEMAATLDRAAQAAATLDERLRRWTEAIRLLDEVRAKYPKFPHLARFDFQAAVYQWAEARSWSQALELAPSDEKAHVQAIAAWTPP